MKGLSEDIVDSVILLEATILQENVFWDSGDKYPFSVCVEATVKKLITYN